jgi:cystathionine gamma-lyase
VLVDNTFLSPYYQTPLKLGADAVLHSLTKYVNGHSDVVMGAVILKSPGENSSPHLGHFISRLRFLQNAIGAVPSPYDSWLAQRGAKTLQLRMRQHGLNALAVARALEKAKTRGLVRDIVYPGLRSHPRFGVAYKTNLSDQARRWIDSLRGSRPIGLVLDSENDTYDPDRHGIPFGGMISFRINGAENETDRFLAHLKFFSLAESLGGVESLAEVPEKMTHGVSAISPGIRDCVLTIFSLVYSSCRTRFARHWA